PTLTAGAGSNARGSASCPLFRTDMGFLGCAGGGHGPIVPESEEDWKKRLRQGFQCVGKVWGNPFFEATGKREGPGIVDIPGPMVRPPGFEPGTQWSLSAISGHIPSTPMIAS